MPSVRAIAPEMHQVAALNRNHLEIPVVVLDQSGGAERPVAETGRPVPRLGGDATVAPPVRKPASRQRSDHLEIAVLRALHKAGRATRNRAPGQVGRAAPPGPHNAMHVHMTASTELVVTALATDRRKLPRLQGVS